MNGRDRRTIARSIGALLAALTLCAVPQPASAGGFLEALFGSFHRHVRPMPPQSSAFADPFGIFDRRHASGEAGSFGRGTFFCVRTCDGRYFPLQHHANMTPAEACRAFCPAAKTIVFSGSKIDVAVAQNGARYADLDKAFAYRDKVIDHCSCNGRDGLGLARLDAASDPTLRPGDIVATAGGLATYTGGKSGTAEYTPISTSSSEWARRLADVKVEPAPPPDKAAPATTTDKAEPATTGDIKPRPRNSRAQAAR